MIRILEDGSVRFNGSTQITVEQLCRYFRCKQEDLEAFLLQKLKEKVKRPKQ